MKYKKPVLLVFIILLLMVSCNKSSNKINITTFVDMVKPTEFIEPNKVTEIIYNHNQITNIFIENDYTNLVESYWGTDIEYSTDTFNFKYENSKLIAVEHICTDIDYEKNEERTEELNPIEYNSEGKVESVSYSDYSVLYTYDDKSRLSSIKTKANINFFSSVPRVLNYDEALNILSDCDSDCISISSYDQSANPYNSINQMLGYPFFDEFRHLSHNNPIEVTNATNFIKPLTDEYKYVYDNYGRVIGINSTIKIKY